MAEEQGALLRKGIGDIFINLARRNQTLLDRQIEFIDQLEANEEDPDQLDNLFKLDHLATRMRRNAESLLVLAGAEPPRRRGRPVALADVVRVAIGEVEDFARISLLALDDVTVGGNVAVDLAHLLSELMENATHFSPPDTTVEIVGHRSDEGYTLSVSDQGIGMSADQLAEANSQLARPPLVGLALSRSLGFIVIGRLAARFGIAVKLTSSPSGGVTALVTLPADLVTVDGQPMVARPADRPPAAAAAAAGRRRPRRPETDAAVDPTVAVGRRRSSSTRSSDAGHRSRRRGRRSPLAAELDESEVADEPLVADDGRAGWPTARGRRLLDDLAEEPGVLPRRRPRGRRVRARPAVAGQRRARPRPGRGRPGQLPTEPATSVRRADSVPGAFGGPACSTSPRPRRPRSPSRRAEDAPRPRRRPTPSRPRPRSPRSPPPAW